MNQEQRDIITERRRKVSEQLQQGWSQSAIADELRISRSTVKRDIDFITKQTEKFDALTPFVVSILNEATKTIVERIQALPELNNAFPDVSTSGLILVTIDNDQKKLLYDPDSAFLGLRIGLDLKMQDAIANA